MGHKTATRSNGVGKGTIRNAQTDGNEIKEGIVGERIPIYCKNV